MSEKKTLPHINEANRIFWREHDPMTVYRESIVGATTALEMYATNGHGRFIRQAYQPDSNVRSLTKSAICGFHSKAVAYQLPSPRSTGAAGDYFRFQPVKKLLCTVQVKHGCSIEIEKSTISGP
ncbi:hypothetical protein [Paraburkholderia dipogonis]|uniref:hypothetical protein n=1 Tax=Paraburkholderia dipogonis TaxID=1211383 RepID=UPI0038BE00C8